MRLYRKSSPLSQGELVMVDHTKLEALFRKAGTLAPVNAAIVCPESAVSLEGAVLAAEQKSIVPILIGIGSKIKKIAQEIGRDISSYQLIDLPEAEAVKQAVKLAQEGIVQLIVKGSLHTFDFMHAIVQRESGLRVGQRMSHCQVVDMPSYKKLLIITDAVLNTFPGVKEKKDIIQNAIDLAIKLGIAQPKVALLSAVEQFHPRIPTTTECIEICKLAASGDITGGIVEGPISLDLAISEQSVKIKKFNTQVGGDTDILVVPNIEVGNILMKSLDYFANALGLGIIVGAKIPIVLTSRSASAFVRSRSCVLTKFIHSNP